MAKIRSQITEARRELKKIQNNAKFFTSQYRQLRAQKSDLAEPYKVMTKYSLEHVRRLKRYIKGLEDLEKQIDELDRRIAKFSVS